MRSTSIIDSHMAIRVDLDGPAKANSLFLQNPSNRAHFARQLLLYDQIVIPTHDFGIVPILISWLGLGDFEEALQSGALGFIKKASMLAYVGGGLGVSMMQGRAAEQHPLRWPQEGLFGDPAKAIELQLMHACSFIDLKRRSTVTSDILQNCKEVDFQDNVFLKNIQEESYADVQNDRTLSAMVIAFELPRDGQVDLKRLGGVKADQIRVLGLGSISDAVDLVLRVAEINMEIVLSALWDSADVYTSNGADKILKGKLRRAGVNPAAIEGLIRLLELNNVPDVGQAVVAGSVSFGEIWKLRQKKESVDFRAWLRKADPSDARELERAFVAALSESPLSGKLGVRALRFAITTAVGLLVPPPAGIALDAVDSFFVDKWIEGYSPKLFFDELRKLPL